MKLSDLIAPYAPAEGPPPNRLWPFFRWALRGTFPIIVVASLFAGAVGTLEAFTAIMLGLVIDAVVTSGPERFISDNVSLFLMLFGFFVVFNGFDLYFYRSVVNYVTIYLVVFEL